MTLLRCICPISEDRLETWNRETFGKGCFMSISDGAAGIGRTTHWPTEAKVGQFENLELKVL